MKKMKSKPRVFIFGTNCASVLNSLTLGFEELEIPVKTVSFDFKRSKYNNFSKIECICTDNDPNRFQQILYKIKGLFVITRYLLWCDVVHLYGNFSRPSFWFISKFVKHKFVTFVGSDIRMPEKELAINPYFKYAYSNKNYEYKGEGDNNSRELLIFLKKLHYQFIAWDMEMFLDRDIVGNVAIAPHASVNMLPAIHNDDTNDKRKILIIHSPTAPVAKGTEFVLKAIKELERKNVPFEFQLLENLSNEEYQQALQKADIYVDQLIWGAYGVAAQQALQMGKVVVAYLSPERIKLYGDDVPIQNATINNLSEVLENLISNKALRERISDQSIAYYEKMHKPKNVANNMLSSYKNFRS
jgi:hypothetical protein